jgi:hypothetical protein
VREDCDRLSHLIHSSSGSVCLVVGQDLLGCVGAWTVVASYSRESLSTLLLGEGMYTPVQTVVCFFISRESHSVCSWTEIGTLCTICWHAPSFSRTRGREFLQPCTLRRVFSFLLILITSLVSQGDSYTATQLINPALLVHPCRTYRWVCFRVSSLIDTSSVRSCQFRPMPHCYRLRIPCQPSSDPQCESVMDLFNFIIPALKKN